MKTIYKRLGIGLSTIAACTSLALAAQASYVIQNWYLGNGLCYSPQVGYNDCNLTQRFNVKSKSQLCGGYCGSWNGYTIFEVWQIIV
ncbi:hypothetical protein [Sorangium sp. So ce1000]|uniref:hypothetical protein n=1 Tax=Sorangium sp. So ce1000 TaxID=3133325 RepID=UPI003F5FDEDF